MGLSSELSALRAEAQTLAQRLRRLAVALALTEDLFAEHDNGSEREARTARRIACECRQFVARLDALSTDDPTSA